jgi:hypothetical protein
VRVDLDDVGSSLTPTDALSKSGWSVNGNIIRGGEGNGLAAREVDKLGGDSDGWCAEAYLATIMGHLNFDIPAGREDGVFPVGSLQRDKIVALPLFRKWEVKLLVRGEV